MQIFAATWTDVTLRLTFHDTDFGLKKFLDLRLEQAYAEYYLPKKKWFFKGLLKTDVTFGSFAYLYTNFWTLISIRLGTLFYGHKGLLF